LALAMISKAAGSKFSDEITNASEKPISPYRREMGFSFQLFFAEGAFMIRIRRAETRHMIPAITNARR